MVNKIPSRPKINHYICINESGLEALGDRYKIHLAVTVQSAVINANISTHLIYDGPPTDYVMKLADLGCSVIYHELSFKEKLKNACRKNSVNFDVASGAFLRLDIPLLDQSNDCVLYTDVDVMFRSNPDFSKVASEIMAAAPEMNIENYDHINSGVLLINLKGFRKELPEFIDRIIDGNLKTSSGDPYDQGHINDFFRGRLSRMDPKFNWKPYWGFNDDSVIVHWHGVKYPAAKAISLGMEELITNYHAHPEIYRRSPSGYRSYVEEFENFVRMLPKSLVDNVGSTSNRKVIFGSTSLHSCADIGYVLGPSHAVRWNVHSRDKVVPNRLPFNKFLGVGGGPIWSRKLFDYAKVALEEAGRVAFLVPDFRFGNDITLNAPYCAEPLLRDDFHGINVSAMTADHDRIMLARGISALRFWHERFGSRVRYIFWCLFGREIHDRMAGKYISDGRYKHPVFNYGEITAALSDLDVIDLSPLLRRPMHEVRRLFVDSSSHPSQVGYLLLNGLVFDGLEANAAYDRAVSRVEADLIAIARKIRDKVGKKILLTGRSVWLDVLMTTLGANGAAKLAEAGLVLIPIDHSPGQPRHTEILIQHSFKECKPVVISAGGRDLSALLDMQFETPIGFWEAQPVIDWESSTEVAILSRGELPKFTRISTNFRIRPDAIQLNFPDHSVELGPLGMPSWTGILAVLQALIECASV